MAYKDGSKSGGRQKGTRNKSTRNKSTLNKIQMMKDAAEVIKNADGSVMFHGDGCALLVSVYKNEAFPIEFRTSCAEAAARFEKPATENKQYVAVMPPELPAGSKDDQMAVWWALHGGPSKSGVDDPIWNEALQTILRLIPTRYKPETFS